jgi:hypothetical protein
MNRHVVIAFAVLGVMIFEWIWKTSKRRRHLKRAFGAGRPDLPIEEHLSPSGRFKVVVYPHAEGVFRVEVFERLAADLTEPYWFRTGEPSFVDRGALVAILDETARKELGE